MLTALTVKDYSAGRKKRHFFKKDKTELEVIKYGGIQLVHIIYRKYGKEINWKKIRELAGSESKNILCDSDISFPPESGLKRYTTNLLKERIAENTALEVMKRCKAHVEELSAGLYDESGKKSEIVSSIIKYTGRLTVVTSASEEYYRVYKQTLSNTGAVLNIRSDISAFKGCGLIIAPQKLDKLLPVDDDTLIFTSEEPSVCQRGIVYSKYIIALSNSYKEIKPHSLSDEYFAQALYDKGRQYRLGSMLPVLCISNGINSTVNELSQLLSRKIVNQMPCS